MSGPEANAPERSTAAGLIALWATLHDTIVGAVEGELGQDGLRRILYQPMFTAGQKAAVAGQPDASHIGGRIMRLEQDFGLRGRVLVDGPERFVREVTECPWAGVRPASCRVFAWWMEGYCQGLNSAFRYRLERLIPEGAETCVWSVSRDA